MVRFVLLMLVFSCAHLQAQGNAPSGPGGGNSNISGRGGGADAMGGASTYRHSVNIRGRVELENGAPATTDTLIELRCIGQPVMEQEVRTDGTFNFQFTAANPESKTGPASFAGVNFGVEVSCQIQAMLNGHYSPQGTVFGKETTGMFDAGTIRLYKKQGDATGMTVSATSLQAPKDAKRDLQKGQQEAARKKWKDAAKLYEKALAAYPEYAEAWYEMGRVQQIQKKADDARASYEKAIAADPNYIPPSVRLALLDVQDGNWEQVAQRTGEVLKLNPYEFPEAYIYNVLANYQLDNLAEAEAMARKGLERNVQTTYPQLLHTLGMVLAAQGKLEDAITEYERFFETAPDHPDRKAAEQQLAIIRENL